MHNVEEGRGDDIPRPPPQGEGGRRVAAAPLSPQEEKESYFSNHYSLISSAALSCLPTSYRIAGERSETA